MDDTYVALSLEAQANARDNMRAVNWRYFCGAAILASGLLVKLGAPIAAVAAGVALAAMLNWGIERRARK